MVVEEEEEVVVVGEVLVLVEKGKTILVGFFSGILEMMVEVAEA